MSALVQRGRSGSDAWLQAPQKPTTLVTNHILLSLTLNPELLGGQQRKNSFARLLTVALL